MSKSTSFRKEGKNLLLATAMAVALLVAIGYAGATDWSEGQLKKKIDKLGKTCPDPEKSPVTGEPLEALKAIVAIQAAGGAVTIADLEAASEEEEDDDDEESEDDDSEEEEEDDDDEESEDDDSEEEEEEDEEEAPAKPAKSDKKKDKKASKPAAEEAPAKSDKKKDKKAEKKAEKSEKKSGGIVKVGIIDAIVDILKATGSAKKALSKKDITAKLATVFPDRNVEHMKATVGVQVPYNLRNKKGLAIEKTEDGKFYMEAAGEKPAKSDKKKDKAKTEEAAPAAEETPAKSDKKKKKKSAK